MPGTSPVKSDTGSPFSAAPACSSAARTASVTTRFRVAGEVVVDGGGAVDAEAEVTLVEPATGVDDFGWFEPDEQPARIADRQATEATARSFFRTMVLLTRIPPS